MSTVLSASAPASFEIKSANLPLVALLLKSADLARLGDELKQRFGDMPDFFDQDPLLIDLSPLTASAETEALVDFPGLLGLLAGYRLRPLAVRGGSPAQMAAAVQAGLVPADDATVQRVASSSPAVQPVQPEQAPVAPPAQPGALIVDRPLRSGQQVYARGRDLVVMAMVNPGAEVIADGSIHVYAPLRGKAIAGARGNPEARIFALAMDPELISIAGIYRTSDKPLPDSVIGRAAQVRLMASPEGEDRLVIDAIAA